MKEKSLQMFDDTHFLSREHPWRDLRHLVQMKTLLKAKGDTMADNTRLVGIHWIVLDGERHMVDPTHLLYYWQWPFQYPDCGELKGGYAGTCFPTCEMKTLMLSVTQQGTSLVWVLALCGLEAPW